MDLRIPNLTAKPYKSVRLICSGLVLLSFFLSPTSALGCTWEVQLLNLWTKEVKYYRPGEGTIKFSVSEELTREVPELKEHNMVAYSIVNFHCEVEPITKESRPGGIIQVQTGVVCRYGKSPGFGVAAGCRSYSDGTRNCARADLSLYGFSGENVAFGSQTHHLSIRCKEQ